MPSGAALSRKLVASVGVGALALLGATGAGAAGTTGPPRHDHWGGAFRVRQVLAGASLTHTFTPAGSSTPQSEPLTKPDDITQLGDHLFVGFQNGVGPQGEASTDGNLDSTVVELGSNGHVAGQWDVEGKVDGLTADPGLRGVIATVNEDANSALYTVVPTASQVVTRYAYNVPLPHDGGTDAISIYRGRIFISASAPGTTGTPATPTPAAYVVTLDPSTQIATVAPLFNDQDQAVVANVGSSSFGQPTTLALTDPDSNFVVPFSAPRFGGAFELTSQGDLEQIYVRHPGSPSQRLAVLSLTQSVDDTAWPSFGGGRLYSTDSTNDAVDVVTGPFRREMPIVVATPCGANDAPATCPAPGFPPNYLATMNPWTGVVTALTVTGVPYTPQGGLAFVGPFGGWGGR